MAPRQVRTNRPHRAQEVNGEVHPDQVEVKQQALQRRSSKGRDDETTGLKKRRTVFKIRRLDYSARVLEEDFLKLNAVNPWNLYIFTFIVGFCVAG